MKKQSANRVFKTVACIVMIVLYFGSAKGSECNTFSNLTKEEISGWIEQKELNDNGQMIVEDENGEDILFERNINDPSSLYENPFTGEKLFDNVQQQNDSEQLFSCVMKLNNVDIEE